MLIIFDLDDTLIDTSGSITPIKLREAFELLMQGRGSAAEWEELIQINQRALKTPDALEEFARKHRKMEWLKGAVDSLRSPLPPSCPIRCTPEAKEVLHHFASKAPIALVTGGHPPLQLEKLKKAGLEQSLFSKMAIPEDSVKKPFYKAFAEELSMEPAQVWVCGDRIEMDLAPARELGFRTVHMRWGRGLRTPTPSWVDHQIGNLTELRNTIR